nr:hypothetical protein [Tanacetum cinerariifolium]
MNKLDHVEVNLCIPRTCNVKILWVPVGYDTDALASFWVRPKTKLRREDKYRNIPRGLSLPSGFFFLQVTFALLVLFFLSYFPSLRHALMSFESRSIGEPVDPKFNMHTFTSSMTAEVSALVEEYAIPSDLHPRVSSSNLTMNNVLVGVIGIYEEYLEMSSVKDRLFLIDRRSIPDAMPWRHHDSNVSDPPPSGVSADDVHQLCENVIDLRLVHSAMLYEIGLTTIWKHVGHHLAFKDGERNVAANMFEFLKFPMARGLDLQRKVERGDQRIIAAKEKNRAQEAQDKAARKRPGRAEAFGHTKKRKIAPLSMALSESEADSSLQGDSGTFHSVTLINTFNPVNTDAEAEGSNQTLQYDGQRSLHSEHSLHSEEHTEIRTPDDDVHLNQRDDNVQHVVAGTEVDEHYAMLRSYGETILDSNLVSTVKLGVIVNPDDKIYFDRFCMCFVGLADGWKAECRRVIALDGCFLKSPNQGEILIAIEWDGNVTFTQWLGQWVLLKLLKLSCQMLSISNVLHIYEGFRKHYIRLEFTNLLLETSKASYPWLFIEIMDMIKRAKPNAHKYFMDRNPKTWSRAFFEVDRGYEVIENGFSECFNSMIVNVRHKPLITMIEAIRVKVLERMHKMREISVRWNPRACLNIKKRFEWLKDQQRWNLLEVRSMSEGFIVDEGKRTCSDADYYDPDCQATFKSDFDQLFVKSYPYVEKLVESFRLPLGDLQNMWSEGEGPTVGGAAVNE